MVEQGLGTARVDLVVNTEQFQAEVARAKNLGASMGPEFEKSMQKMSASQRRATNDALRLAQQTGKTREEIKLISLAARGAAPQSLDALRKSMLATREEAARGATAFNKYGVSHAQYAAAIRGTPAQVTDILVGLQGGQAPLTVLLQQGGQLRDMFGGIVPAARALGGAVLGLVNPLTVTGAAAAALAVAYKQGAAEAEAYTRALAESGNIVGQTAASLGDIAREAADAAGSQGRAAEALAAVVESGKVASGALRNVTEATAEWASATGRDVSDVVQTFAKLAGKPAEAAAELNEQYHFLTAAVYEQIRALEDQGRTEEATTLAQQELAKALKQRARDVKESAGTMERAWGAVAGAARDAWDAMLNVGRPTPIDELRKQAAALQKSLDELDQTEGFATTEGGAAVGGGGRRAIATRRRLATELAALQQEIAQREQDAANARSEALKQSREAEKIAAQQEVADLLRSSRSKTEVRDAELKKLKGQLDEQLITQEQYEKARQAIIDKYKESRGRSGSRSKQKRDYFADGLDDAGIRLGLWSLDDLQIKAADTFGAMADYSEGAFSSMDEFAKEAARNMQDYMGTALKDALRGDFDDIGNSFADLVAGMGAELLASQLYKLLLGDYGSTGVFGGLLGDGLQFLFGGKTGTALGSTVGMSGSWGGVRANGGPTAPGKFYEVNERGPELYTEAGRTFLMSGARGGYVTPLAPPSAASAAATTVAPKVEVNVINQGGEQMSAQASGPRFDGEQWVIDVVLKKARNNRAFRSQLKEAVA